MRKFLNEDLINRKIISKLVREVRKDQLDKTIDEINYFSKLRSEVIAKQEFDFSREEQLNLIKKLNNANIKNLQA